jgi:hypothetical protein
MSDIVKRLQAPAYWISGSNEGHEGENDAPREAADIITRLTAEVEWHKKNSDKWQDTQAAHLREVARLTAEVRVRQTIVEEARDERDAAFAEVEKLKSALRECEAELNAYYRMQYPGDHPHSQKELAKAMASNPATVALKEKP